MSLLKDATPCCDGRKPKYVSEENHCTHIGKNVNASHVEQYRVDGEVFPAGSSPERCDFLLLNEDAHTAYYIELKGGGSDIPKAIRQLTSAVTLLRARHPQCDKIFYRIIYHTGSHETYSSETLRWKKKVGVDRVIIKSRKLEENI